MLRTVEKLFVLEITESSETFNTEARPKFFACKSVYFKSWLNTTSRIRTLLKHRNKLQTSCTKFATIFCNKSRKNYYAKYSDNRFPGLILTSGAYISSNSCSWVQLLIILENQAINITKQLLCLFNNLAAFWLATLGKVLLSSRLQKSLTLYVRFWDKTMSTR